MTNVFSITSTSPTRGSFGLNLEGSGLQPLARVPTATAPYPMESDYIEPKTEAQGDLTVQLGTYPTNYQTTGNEVYSIAIVGNVPQPFIAPGSSAELVQETENPVSLLDDGYQVE